MKAMTKLAFEYQKWIDEESKKTSQELKIRNVGKIDPQKHLEQVKFCLEEMSSKLIPMAKKKFHSLGRNFSKNKFHQNPIQILLLDLTFDFFHKFTFCFPKKKKKNPPLEHRRVDER